VIVLPRFGITVTLLLAAAEVLPGVGSNVAAQPAEMAPLQLEAKIPLGNVHGRTDHMAVDLKRQRLFVAELGNDSVGVVDLANRKLLQTIAGLKEPQGVGYEPSTDTLYVANARDRFGTLVRRKRIQTQRARRVSAAIEVGLICALPLTSSIRSA
jgi:YVTN family beta-propeller protein